MFRFLFFLVLTLPLAANDPGEAALEFLEKLRSQDVDLGPGGDTALKANTSESKQKQIQKNLEKVGLDLAEGILELGGIKQDGNFAAVIVRKLGSFDSSNLNIIPVAMVREDSRWVPAPVPASFENAVLAYTTQVRRRLGALELWMLRERVLDLERIVSDSGDRMRKVISKQFPEGDGLNGGPEEVIGGFLQACGDQNQAAVLGYLGGLEEKRPADWADRLAASKKAVASGSQSSYPWRLVVSPEVIREVVQVEEFEGAGRVSIACLDPALVSKHGSMEKIKLLHFDFRRSSSGRVMIELPGALLFNEMKAINRDEDLDVDLLDRFTEKLRERNDAIFHESSEEAGEAILEAITRKSLRDLLRLVDFSGSAKEARIAATEAAEIWWSANSSKTPRIPVRLGFRENGGLAVASYQWFSVGEPNRFELKTFSLRETTGGWMWASGVVSKEERDDQNILNDWVRGSIEDWKETWRGQLMKKSVRIEKLDHKNLPSDEIVKDLLGEWVASLKAGDIESALACTSWLGAEGTLPVSALRNISYEFENSEVAETKLQKIFRGESWVAASLIHTGAEGEYSSFVPVILTDQGARLILEIDLVVGKGRTRSFLNEATFKNLAEVCGAQELAELRALFEDFEKFVAQESLLNLDF